MKVALVAVVVLVLAVATFLAGRFLFAPSGGSGFDRRSVTLEVFNGCAVPRIARAVADELLRRGFDVYDVGNCDSVFERTVVVDLRDPAGGRAEAVAEELAVRRRFLFFPRRERVLPASRVELDSNRYVDLRLVVGNDYLEFFPGVVALR